MITRRTVFKRLGQSVIGTGLAGAYSVAGEPMLLQVAHYRVRPDGWPGGMRLRIAALADIHACLPWMSAGRIGGIVARTNRLKPDLTVLLGDYIASHPYRTGVVAHDDWAGALGALRAPLGVHAILGNHDWWDDSAAQERGHGPTQSHLALARAGIGLLENRAIRLKVANRPFWLAGLGDQLALRGRGGFRGVDDLPATLGTITDRAPAILLVHEPDIFPEIPARFALTLAGHTHGGQVRFFGRSPVVPSRYGNRFAYGQIVEPDKAGRPRMMIVSGGLGCSLIPVRLGVPPEIVVIDLG